MIDGADPAAYDPTVRRDERRAVATGLLPAAVVAVGFGLAAGVVGVAIGVGLALLWLRLRVELVATATALAFAGIGGSSPLAFGLVACGVAGLLAVDLAATWRSLRPLGAFVAVAAPLGAAAVVYPDAGGRWLVAVAVAATVALLSYGLHRYQLLSLGVLGEETANGAPGAGENDGGPR